MKFKVGDKVRLTGVVKDQFSFYTDELLTVVGFIDDGTELKDVTSLLDIKEITIEMGKDNQLTYSSTYPIVSSIKRPKYLVIVEGYTKPKRNTKLGDIKRYHSFFPLFLEQDKYTLRKEKLKQLLTT